MQHHESNLVLQPVEDERKFMTALPHNVVLRESALDFERFRVRTAKLSIEVPAHALAAAEAARAQGLELLIARCDTQRLNCAQALEEAGFRLMDTLVYFTQRLSARREPALPEGYSWRVATPEDAAAVGALASETFQGYMGHYHADDRLDRRACDDVYADWARRSCLDPGVADCVVLLECRREGESAELAAFATHARVDSSTWEGVLYGVGKQHQGRGLYAELIALGGALGAERGHATMLVSTQVTNLSVQKAWCKQGFLPIRSSYTFHAWFSP
ncbi:MAG: hypothetical protein ACK5QX_09205, partial [bacterium]